jgi:glutamate---cysteine ligase / carboxylate-amine ligase
MNDAAGSNASMRPKHARTETPDRDWFTLGVEEEYLLVDRASKALVADPPDTIFASARRAMGPQVTREMMRSQIEVATRKHCSVAEIRADLGRLRHSIATIAKSFGVAPLAASTHPFTGWNEMLSTPRERYDRVVADLQRVGLRGMIGGMHVHVGIPDDETRIDLMNRIAPFLPLLLALSTSSPFWRGEDTGLKSYRLAVAGEWPRGGFPDVFSGWYEYKHFVDTLVTAEVIPDATMVWWLIRPSARFPTIEIRITDCVTRLDDAMSIVALCQSLMRCLRRRPELNRDYVGYRRLFVDENRWRAQRFGTDASLLDWRRGCLVPITQCIEEVVDLVAEDAEALGCSREVCAARDIAARGTSADVQLEIFRDATVAGNDARAAFERVVEWLEMETLL